MIIEDEFIESVLNRSSSLTLKQASSLIRIYEKAKNLTQVFK